MNETEFKGTGSGSYKIILTQSDLTTTEGKNWEYSGQVYCKLSYNNYTVNTDTVAVTVNTCTHAKYTHDANANSAANRVVRKCSLLTKMVSPIRLNSMAVRPWLGAS